MEPEINHIIQKYKSSIFKTCLGFTNNLEDANDLTQEVFIRIWKGLKDFKEQSTLNTWIYRITVNTCLMYQRKKKVETYSLSNYDDHVLGHVKNEGFKNEEVERLYQKISQLTEKDRLIIILYLEDLSYKEIANVIGITSSNVGVRINRIKKKLIQQL